MNAALALLAAVGATLIVVCSTICRPLQRLWPALFACAQCTGFWVGFFVGLSELAATGCGRIVDAIFFGSATSGLSLLVYGVLLNLLGEPDREK